jgi:hypothetical protein
MRDNVATRRIEARVMNRVVQPGETLITPVIGTLGYHTELFLFDLFGLVSAEVAHLDASEAQRSPGHRKSVTRSFFMAREPDYLMHKSFFLSELGSVREVQRELRRTAGTWSSKPAGARYAPLLLSETVDRGGEADVVHLLLMKRADSDESRRAAMAAFEAAVASL